MSEGYVDLIREGYEAWNAGDRAWVLEHLSPNVEWVTAPADPDYAVYRGHEQVIAFWDQWRAAVGQLEFEVLQLIESGPNVLVITKRSGTGQVSGIQVSDEICQLFTFDGEVCVRVREFYDRTEAMLALRAAVADAEAG